MTEDKRFNLAFYDNYDGTFSIQDTLYKEENKHLHSLDEIIDLLNELSDKCDFLEIENEALEDGATKYAERYHNVLKENEHLKQSYTKLKDRHDLLHDEYVDVECEKYSLKKDVESLEKENEQLKQLLLQFYTEDEINAEMI